MKPKKPATKREDPGLTWSVEDWKVISAGWVRMRDQVLAVRALHVPDAKYPEWCAACGSSNFEADPVAWPCATIRLLDEPAPPMPPSYLPDPSAPARRGDPPPMHG